jgi:hypothetical protein
MPYPVPPFGVTTDPIDASDIAAKCVDAEGLVGRRGGEEARAFPLDSRSEVAARHLARKIRARASGCE